MADETGFPDPEELIQSDIDEAEIAAQNGLTIRSLLCHPGWLILEKFRTAQIESIFEEVLRVKDLSQLNKLQALIQVFRFYPKIVEALLLDAKKAEELLTTYISQDPVSPDNPI